jgi:hypothetical protein
VAVSPFALRKMSKWVKVAPIHGKRNPAPSEVKALLARE